MYGLSPYHSNHNQTMLRFSQGIPAITTNISASSGGGGGYTRTVSNSSSSSTPAPKPKPVTNSSKKETAKLLKTIDELTKTLAKPAPAAEPPPPPEPAKTIYTGSSSVSSPGNLQIAPASGVNKRSGTSNFKRRNKSTTSNILRTIQSVSV